MGHPQVHLFGIVTGASTQAEACATWRRIGRRGLAARLGRRGLDTSLLKLQREFLPCCGCLLAGWRRVKPGRRAGRGRWCLVRWSGGGIRRVWRLGAVESVPAMMG